MCVCVYWKPGKGKRKVDSGKKRWEKLTFSRILSKNLLDKRKEKDKRNFYNVTLKVTVDEGSFSGH